MFGFLKKKVEEFTQKVSSFIKEKPKEKISTKIKKAFVGEVFLSREEIDKFLWDFELALLEGDVAHNVVEQICNEIRNRLLERRFKKDEDIKEEIKNIVKETISNILTIPSFDFIDKVKKCEKPCIILFLGPNGAGKTTTIAKVAFLLRKNNLSSIFSASDTFRAASIEQLEEHGKRLGIKTIRHNHGSDPAAVAFDAIKSAKAHKIDGVLIDTAGRQETNRNLMEELKKICRVTKPHLKIYVDEASAGNVLVERIKQYKENIGIDGIILSKMDLDVKGGGTISLEKTTDIPIIFFGSGQSYEDLQPFNPKEVIYRIFH